MATARSHARAEARARAVPSPLPLAAAGALAALCAAAQPAFSQPALSQDAPSQDAGPRDAAPAAASPPASPAASPVRQAPASFADLAKAKLPAVVTITATGTAGGEAVAGPGGPAVPGLPPGAGPQVPGGPPIPVPPGSPFEDFLDEFFGRGGPGGAMRPRAVRSLGSGFVVDPAGYVVTNNHVVESAEEIEVTFQDDRSFKATLVGTDAATDIALLKIEAGQPLPSLSFGDSDRIQVGDWVIAIGNPFGLGGTVTAGIISARARDIGAGNYDDFLQTDAAINTGNSGGPLIDLAGEVVGMNTAIFSRTGGNIGIGFAVPSGMAREVVTALRDKGYVTRGYLGVTIQPVTPDIADALGIAPRTGALVSSVAPGSPAADAGLRPGDVITQVDGQGVERPRDLSRRVADLDPGQPVKLSLLRDGKQQSLSAKVGELPRADQQVAAVTEAPAPQGTLGLMLAPINPETRQRFGLEEGAEGALVTAVAPGSPAAERGFRPGDIITRANRTDVKSPQDVAGAVEEARKAGRDSVVVLRRTEEGAVFVPLPLAGPGQAG
ncbi:DegQ family serine endoprotease [Oleisolibacter albus]|uniref:DegQ family serine endoprotease n=1 Tax=Oleisolibacter albus TaxID=2171757 RepID=UPI000DF18D9D|nr:DegQ family serine endoprotease [Oleisolibacter albus]